MDEMLRNLGIAADAGPGRLMLWAGNDDGALVLFETASHTWADTGLRTLDARSIRARAIFHDEVPGELLIGEEVYPVRPCPEIEEHVAEVKQMWAAVKPAKRKR